MYVHECEYTYPKAYNDTSTVQGEGLLGHCLPRWPLVLVNKLWTPVVSFKNITLRHISKEVRTIVYMEALIRLF